MLAVDETVAVGSTGTPTDIAGTFASAPEQNDLISAVVMTRSSTLTNPSGYTTDLEVLNAVETDILRFTYKVAGASESDTVTFTGMSGSDGSALHLREISGGATASVEDAEGSTGRTTGVTSLASGDAVTGNADDILIAGVAIRNAITNPSVTNSFVNLQHSAGNAGLEATLLTAERIVAATGTYNTTASWTNSVTAWAGIVSYKAAAAGTSILRQMMMHHGG